MGTCGQSRYVFRGFCVKQGIDVDHFFLHRVSWFWVKCPKRGIKRDDSNDFCLTLVLNRVRIRGAGPHLPTQGYIEYPPPLPGVNLERSAAKKLEKRF